jgi:hypothetical protein
VTCSSRYKRTVVVSPGDTPTQSGAALYDAIWTTQQNNTGLDRYLIVLEPGVYNIGTGIELPQYIDLQGAGRTETVIKATGSANANAFYSGAAIRAQGFYDHGITIRDLTIEQNAAPGDHAAALNLVNTALELDNVALTLNVGAAVAGLRVYVAAFLPRLKDVEINAYSGERGAVVDGIAIGSGNMLVDGGKVSASANGQGATANGIRVGTEGAASLQLQDVDVSAGGTTPVAVRIKDGSVTAYNSRIGSSGYAVLADPGTTNWMLYSVLGGERAGPLTCAESLESSSFAALGADCS